MGPSLKEHWLHLEKRKGPVMAARGSYFWHLFCLFVLWLLHVACGILVPWPVIKPGPSAVEAWSPNHGCMPSCSVMSDCLQPPWVVAPQVPLSMELPMQECWSGLPFPSPGDLPDPGLELMSPALVGGFFITEPPGKLPKDHQEIPLTHFHWEILHAVSPHSFIPSLSRYCHIKQQSHYFADRTMRSWPLFIYKILFGFE